MRHLAGLSPAALLGPVRVGWLRAALEGIVGAAILIAIIVLSDPQYQPGVSNGASVLIGLLSSIWLVCWPAWRMRTTTGRTWWRRWRTALGRSVLCGLTVGVTASIFDALWPPLARFAQGDSAVWAANAVQILILFLCARLFIAVAAALRRRARRRLLWQLTASHFAVIVLTFVAMMAVSSVIAASLLLVAARPSPRETATSVASLLRLSGAATPATGRNTQAIVDAIESGRLPLRGLPALSVVAPTAFVPIRTLVLNPDGSIRAAALNRNLAQSIHLSRATAALPHAVLPRLRAAALAGHSASAPVNVKVWFSKDAQPLRGQTVFSAAPVLDAAGRPAAIAVVQVHLLDSLFTPSQFLASTIELFGVVAFVLLLFTALPLLGLSTLFGYILARSLTRRLEAVSRVTMAIAAGDLTQRAPIMSANEVGQLAGDVNRMAAHLETAMGELRRARTQAEDALKARQELVASISHELRTPLAIVRAHLDTLALRPAPAHAGADAPEAWADDVTVPDTTLRALQNETERLAALVDDLFTLSRAETGALQVYCRPVDVAVLVDDVATLMRPLAQSEGMIALSVEAPPGLPAALADADRLRQILENLVRNAVRHTPDGGIIVLSAALQDPWIVVSVADTGEGIPAEHLPHIFERFYRVDQARARSSGGAGLGLALVREFVELMGGHVSVESAVGDGSCFHVYLPLASGPSAPTQPLSGTA